MQNQPEVLSQQDRNFIMQAAAGGIAEVKLSQLALERASQDEVREFGQQMIQEHTDANNELQQLVTSKGASVSDDMDEEHRDMMKQLSSLTGFEFDRAYINAMVNDHIKVVSEFERETTSGQDTEVMEWAKKTLPKLEDHLRIAQDLSKRH